MNITINEDIVLYNNCKVFAKYNILIDQSGNPIKCFPNYFINQCNHFYKDIDFESSFKNLETPVFFSLYDWSRNYHINYIEILPSIFFYIELLKTDNNLYYICDKNYSVFYEKIFDIFNLNKSLILCITENLFLNKVYVSNFSNKYYNGCKQLSDKHYMISNIIRNYFQNNLKDNNIVSNKFIYINRKITPKNSGNNRFIINNSELTEYLINKQFQTIEFEEMTLDKKFLSIANSKIVISPIGANLVNFFFSINDSIKLFILLAPKIKNGYVDFNLFQLKELGEIKPEIVKIVYCDVVINNVSKDPSNNPYLVKIEEIDSILNEFL
jgi:capsular polysaccharide biosynthesis protein